MHLFKNKTKDVKQFLEEMKANKTNRSSNANNLQNKINKPPRTTSPEPYHTDYRSNPIAQSRPQFFDHTSQRSSSDFSRHDSDSLKHSIVSNSRPVHSVYSVGPTYAQNTPPQHPSQYLQRPSQEQGFYNEKSSRQIYNERPPYIQTERFTNFQPVSEPLYNEHTQPVRSNRPQIFYDTTRSHLQYQKPIIQSFNPYQSQVQQGHYQGKRNFIEISGERISQNFNSSTSQKSVSRSYDEPQFYQHPMSNKSQNWSPQSELRVTQSQQRNFLSRTSQPRPQEIVRPVVNKKFQTQRIKNTTEPLPTQFDQKSLMNQSQISNSTYKKEIPRLYTSQISQISKPMAEISEIDDCFSTENDSPAKLTQFLSKIKHGFSNIEEIENDFTNHGTKQIEVDKITEHKSFVKKQKTYGKTPDFGRSIDNSPPKNRSSQKKIPTPNKQIITLQINHSPSNQNLSPSLGKKVLSPPKKKKIQEKEIEEKIKTKQKVSQIKVSLNQRHRMEKALYQFDQVHIKLDGILKETSIILNNIKRSDNEFRKMIEMNILINKGKKRRVDRIEIDNQEVNIEQNEVGTEKKLNKKDETSKDLMNEKLTYKKKRNGYEQIEI